MTLCVCEREGGEREEERQIDRQRQRQRMTSHMRHTCVTF